MIINTLAWCATSFAVAAAAALSIAANNRADRAITRDTRTAFVDDAAELAEDDEQAINL